ncbi:MAG TPA: helix-turn-helix transcriptional regulator [Thermoanaerobaculia bacterium]|nr:helix-turn-helix transcriptional regulator [Thermoanaerobaculia bacterium]
MAREHDLHLGKVLKYVIEVSDLSARAIERKLGMCGGYISRLTSGRIELKMSHLFRILEVLEMPPEEFFALSFPLRPGKRSALMQRILAFLPSAELAQSAQAAADLEEKRLMLDGLRLLLAERQAAKV